MYIYIYIENEIYLINWVAFCVGFFTALNYEHIDNLSGLDDDDDDEEAAVSRADWRWPVVALELEQVLPIYIYTLYIYVYIHIWQAYETLDTSKQTWQTLDTVERSNWRPMARNGNVHCRVDRRSEERDERVVNGIDECSVMASWQT